MDDRISSAERISTYNPSAKCMEPSRSVKVTLNMKNVPSELHINFIGRFFVRSYVTKPVRCYRCQRFGHLAAACLAKLERCSMCSGHHRTQQCIVKIQNSELVKLKCANCGEEHSANSNRCSVLREKNAAKNEPCICKITYNYHETAATICYIDRIPTCVYQQHQKYQRHQEKNFDRNCNRSDHQLFGSCKTSCSEICGAGCTVNIQDWRF